MISFNAAGLLREPPGTTRQLRLRDHYASLAPEVELAGPIDADLRLQRTNRGVLVRGEIRALLRRTCGRCTDPFVDEVGVLLDEEFLPSVDPDSGAPLDAPAADESAMVIDSHHEIRLEAAIRDELALSEPMHPLCRPDCPGLCAGCGRRLDVGSCACETDEIDPRLAVLARLLEGDESER